MMNCFGAVLTLVVIGLFVWVIRLSRRASAPDPRLEQLTRQLVALEQRLTRLERRGLAGEVGDGEKELRDGKDLKDGSDEGRVVTAAAPVAPWAVPVAFPAATPEVVPAGAPASPVAAPVVGSVAAPVPPPPVGRPARPAKRPFDGWEKNLATKAPIWLGAIALALAGVFLVKYSFEQGWISPTIRVALGILFGLGLLVGGEFLRKKSPRIGEALSAAAIADLFACFLAGIHLYRLIPPGVGFGLMVLTTAVAVGLSLRQGPIVAIVGLIGGYLTPLLVRTGSGDAGKLFAYLLVLQIGLLAVSKKRAWWPIAGASLAAGLLWVAVWLTEPYKVGDGLWLGLFLLVSAASAVVAILGVPKKEGSAAIARGPAVLAGLAVAAALGVLAFVAGRGGFAPTEIGLFALLGAGALFLAHRRADLEPLAWVSAVLSAALVAVWGGSIGPTSLPAEVLRFVYGAAALGALFALGGYVGLWRARHPGRWGSLSAAAALAFFLIVWAVAAQRFPMVHFGAWSLGLAVLGLLGALPLATRRKARPELSPALAALAVAITTFVSLAAPMELERPWIAVAWALEVAALVWLAGRFNLPALRTLARVVAASVAVRLLLNPFVLEYPIGERPIWNWLLYGYGVPLAAFALAAWLARRQAAGWPDGAGPNRPARLGSELEVGAVAFAFALITLQIRQLFHPGRLGHGDPTFTEWSSYDAAWLLLGLGLLWVAHSRPRKSFRWTGVALFGLGLAATFAGPSFLLNPLWNDSDVGALPVLNLLLFGFGVPIVLLLVGAREARRRGWGKTAKLLSVASLLLAFLLLSLEVRQAFHGGLLSQGETTTAERYAYSVAWLVFGLGLLALGIRRKSTALRWASLAVTLLAVAKVFLYDASNLTGLYRVVSFLGLGASLLGLAFVYQKYVFGRADATEERAGTPE